MRRHFFSWLHERIKQHFRWCDESTQRLILIDFIVNISNCYVVIATPPLLPFTDTPKKKGIELSDMIWTTSITAKWTNRVENVGIKFPFVFFFFYSFFLLFTVVCKLLTKEKWLKTHNCHGNSHWFRILICASFMNHKRTAKRRENIRPRNTLQF